MGMWTRRPWELLCWIVVRECMPRMGPWKRDGTCQIKPFLPCLDLPLWFCHYTLLASQSLLAALRDRVCVWPRAGVSLDEALFCEALHQP